MEDSGRWRIMKVNGEMGIHKSMWNDDRDGCCGDVSVNTLKVVVSYRRQLYTYIVNVCYYVVL